MANHRRGDVALRIGGETWTLRLTLGALAELEGAFGVDDLSALAERLAAGRLRSADLVAVLGAGLRGAGRAIEDAEIAALPLAEGVEPLARAAVEALALAFGSAPADPPGARAP